MGLNYSLLIYGERRCYLALRSLGTFLMRENTYLFFNVFYFVLGYTSADWYKAFKTCGLDDQVLMQHTHSLTYTRDIHRVFAHIWVYNYIRYCSSVLLHYIVYCKTSPLECLFILKFAPVDFTKEIMLELMIKCSWRVLLVPLFWNF